MSAYLGLMAAGFGLGISVAAPLGPVNAAAIREGLERGAWSAFMVGLGAATVDLFYLSLVYTGVAPLLLRLPALMILFYVMGAALIGQMAYQAFQRAFAGGLPTPVAGTKGRSAFLFGLGVTLFSPATIVLWLTLGGAFASAYLTDLSVPAALLVLIAVASGTAFWFLVLALILGAVRRAAGQRVWVFRLINLAAGLALTGFALLFLSKALTGSTNG